MCRFFLYISKKSSTFAAESCKDKIMANTLNVQGTEITIIKVHAEDGRK